jgi:hypothetical protein
LHVIMEDFTDLAAGPPRRESRMRKPEGDLSGGDADAGALPPDYRDQWDLFEVRCRDVRVAASYAARQNWWLHCWRHVESDCEEPEVVVVGSPRPPFVEVVDDGRTQAERYFR